MLCLLKPSDAWMAVGCKPRRAEEAQGICGRTRPVQGLGFWGLGAQGICGRTRPVRFVLVRG